MSDHNADLPILVGLRQGQGWTLAALGLAGVAVFPFWWVVFRPFT